MSIYGTAGQATYSVSYSNLDAMIADLKDNTSNAIHAQQIRNSVLTLWERSSTASSPSTSIVYSNNTQSTTTIGGIAKGTSFSNISISSIFDLLFYPYISPTISYFNINYGNSGTYSNIIYREYGSPTSSIFVNYTILQGSTNLIGNPSVSNSVIINGNPTISHSGVSGNWNINTLATQSGTIAISNNLNTTLNIYVNDGYATYSSTASIIYQNKIYWGSFNTNPATYSFTSSTILGLTGAGVGTGNLLTSSRIQNFNNINGNGGYLIFAMPISYGTPSFVTNGMLNTAFSNTNINFINIYGYAASYSIWYSNTVQYSPITLFQIN